MAFKDSNGKITINEIAAQKDISNIEAAIDDLKAARDSLNEIKYQAQSFQGKTAVAMEESSVLMVSKYNALIDQLETTKSLISETVEKYRKIDENLTKLINS